MLDNLMAFRVILMLVTPFKDTKAFKLGIIDADGNLLRKIAEFKTAEEKEAYNMLTRLVFNLKRILAKLPGGDSKLKNLAAAYFLVKEHRDNDLDEILLEHEMRKIVSLEVTLVEETVTIMDFLKLFEEGEGAPANVTGAMVSTDEPVIKPKRKKAIV
jgi:hypothetical protein